MELALRGQQHLARICAQSLCVACTGPPSDCNELPNVIRSMYAFSPLSLLTMYSSLYLQR